MTTNLTDPKAPTIAVGTRCIHTSKWEKRRCRVVAFDGAVVVVKMERGGYVGVPEKSLTPESLVKGD